MTSKILAQGASTLWDQWLKNVQERPHQDAFIHWSSESAPVRWTFSALFDAAAQKAALLKERGVRSGDVCALIIRHHPEFYPVYFAVSALGAIPAVLAYPNPRLHPEKFRKGLEGMAEHSGLDWILTEADLESTLRGSFDKNGGKIKGILFPLQEKAGPRADIAKILAPVKENDPLLLQHSSGTTGLQKPVVLSHRAVLEHLQIYAETIHLDEADKVVSWLPLYHDMGLIAAFHMPLAFGIPSVQIDPFEWISDPALLLEVISKEKGTLAWLPNFAYNIMADKIPDDRLNGISLASWRMSINCSEPVRNDSHQRFMERYAKYGFKKSALATAYAMAETTFAATQSEPGESPPCVAVDRQELRNGKIRFVDDPAKGRACVSSGKILKGCSIRIVGEDGVDLASGRVGELVIQSVSMFDGYRNYPEKTAAALKDGWYWSGDYGFKHGDFYYVVGRKKDLIIVAGNNIYPEDVEDAVGAVEGVIPGRVVAFAEDDASLGSEQVSVIAETAVVDEKEKSKLKIKILQAGMAVDVTIRKVYLVPPRWLIKSSSGKPSRKDNKERIAQ